MRSVERVEKFAIGENVLQFSYDFMYMRIYLIVLYYSNSIRQRWLNNTTYLEEGAKIEFLLGLRSKQRIPVRSLRLFTSERHLTDGLELMDDWGQSGARNTSHRLSISHILS